MYLEAIVLALANLKTNKTRFLFSLLGISIGVILAVMTILLSASFKNKMMQEMKVAGDTIINIALGNKSNTLNYFPRPIFTDNHVSIVKSIKNVDEAYGIVSFPVQKGILARKSQAIKGKLLFQNTIFGTDPGYLKAIGVRLAKGKVFTKKTEVVIGNEVAKAAQIVIGDLIVIENKGQKQEFEVCGIIEKQLNLAFSDFGQVVNNLLIVSKENFPDLNYSLICVRANNRQNIDQISMSIEKIINNDSTIHNILSNSTYNVVAVSQKNVIDMVNRWFQYISIFVMGLSVLASIIAMVGVINVMLITFYERIREIGIIKAIGASDGQVLFLYLVESGLLGILGTIIGFIIGVGSSILITKAFGFKFIFEYTVIVVAILLGFGAALIAGFIPARKASGLDPNKALMYE